MKCIIPGTNIKVFGRSIHSLSKIGEELYIEPLEHGLALRTVNSSRSAYACFLFAPSFFHHYDDGADELTSQDSEDTLRCKIAMKSILTVFRSLSTMEKTVDRCKITLDMKASRLVFRLHCRHGIVKTHNLAFIECETLQAVFSKDMCPNSLTASSKLLCDTVANFQNTQEEITLIVNPQKILFKNYVEDEPDPTKVMHTNLTLDPNEFDNCQIGVDTEVTFCLKELRAILAFSEITCLPLTLHFETAGRPIVFSIDSDSTFEGNFVLASLADQQSVSQAPSQGRAHTQHQRSRTQKPMARVNTQHPVMTDQKMDNSRQSRPAAEVERSQRVDAAYDELMNDDEDFEDMIIEQNTTVCPPSTSRIEAATSKERGPQSAAGSDSNIAEAVRSSTRRPYRSPSPVVGGLSTKRPHRSPSPVAEGLSTKHPQRSPEPVRSSTKRPHRSPSPVAGGSGDPQSPVIPVLGTKAKFLDTSVNVDVDEEDEEPVPGTPPAKKFRSLFFGFTQSQSSQKPKNISTVLAEDTDEED